jgi:sarcosine oxidase
MLNPNRFDVAVIGAGVFGSWVAYQLRLSGASVVLCDAFGPGNSRATSGGESRIIRCGYGPDEIYSRSAKHSLALWLKLLGTETTLFKRTGVLWLANGNESYCQAILNNLQALKLECERLEGQQLQQRFPQLDLTSVSWAILESGAGVMMARRAVQEVVNAARSIGVEYREEAVLAPEVSANLQSVKTVAGGEISAGKFVFACGPWLPKIFPAILGSLIHVTRQEVFFFGVPPGSNSYGPDHLPAWIDFNDLVYALPDLDGRGLKLAVDAHGDEFDPDNSDRLTSATGLAVARERLARRVPGMKGAPLLEARVCQYENTSNGDFLIDRHPDFENVWLVGGGSGHGFKHGPAVGEYVVSMLSGTGQLEPRFSLATKKREAQRQVF